MIENIKDFWYLYLLLAALIVILPFALKKGFGAAARHSKEFNENMAKLQHAKELRDAYGTLTSEIIAGAPADTLFEGVAVCLEIRCQKTENTAGFYSALTDGQRKIYSLYYLLTDAKEKNLSAFFKCSAHPLTTDAAAAADEILPVDISKVVRKMFDCYDENNEDASVIPETVNKLDEEFAALTENKNLFEIAGKYIKDNPELFA